MGRKPCCPKVGMNRGAWTPAEDKILTDYIKLYGEGKWRNLTKNAGLKRCGKSCRLRWINYLKPDIKRGNITVDEEELIIRLHKLLGNRWSLIAGRLPGRTDNEIKNYWNTILARKLHGHADAATSSTRKPSGRSGEIHKKETSMPLKGKKLEVEPAMRAKAMKVSKVLDLMNNNANQKGMTETMENNGKEHENSVLKQSYILNYENELGEQDQLLSLFTTEEENNTSNFMLVDYTWDDSNLSDLLDSSEFSNCCGLMSHENDMNMDIDWMLQTAIWMSP